MFAGEFLSFNNKMQFSKVILAFLTNGVKVVLCFLFCLLSPVILAANLTSPGLAAIKIETPKALGNLSINKILVDSNGFIWLATNDGLWRYNGNKLKQFAYNKSNVHSPGSTTIRSLVEDRKGFLWLLTQNAGLSRFDPTTEEFRHFRYDVNNANSLSSDNLNGIHLDDEGNLWIGTVNGVNILNTDDFNVRRVGLDMKPLTSNEGPFVFYAYPDSSGNIWMPVRRDGFYRYDRVKQQLYKVEHIADDQTTIDVGLPTSVYESSDGTVWITTNNGINRFNRANETFTRFYPKKKDNEEFEGIEASAIMELPSGELIVGSRDRGLAILKNGESDLVVLNSNQQAYEHSVDSFYIADIQTDRSNTLWIATYPKGLYKISPKAGLFDFYTLKEDKKTTLSGMITTNDGRIIVAQTDGLYEYDPKNNEFSALLENSNYIIDMTYAGDNMIYLHVWKEGIKKFDLETKQLEPVIAAGEKEPLLKNMTNIRAMAYKDGILYIGLFSRSMMEPGVFTFDTKTKVLVKRNKTFTVTHVVPWNDKLLIGTSTKGVQMMDVKSGQWQALTPEIENNFVYALFKDRNNEIWLGAASFGVTKLDPDNPVLDFLNVDNGLLTNHISAITDDSKGNLWLATPKGTVLYNPKNKKIEHFDINDGLRGQGSFAFWAATDLDDNIIFNNYIWFTVFNANKVAAIRDSKQSTGGILLSDFRLFNEPKTTNKIDPQSPLPKTLNNLDEITLQYSDSWFSLAFSSSSYALGDRAKYAYQMKGLSDKWIEADKNNQIVSFSSLSPKSYELSIRSGSDDGTWHDNIRSLKVNILPPWWLTWQAYLLYIVLSVTLIVVVFRYRTKALTQRAEDLEKGIEERTQTINKLMAQKDRMFANISHEFKTPLTLILNPLDNIHRALEASEFDRKVSMMKRNSKRLLRMVDQLLELSKLETTKNDKRDNYSLHETLSVLLTSFQPLIDSKSMRLECNNYKDTILSLKPDSLEIILTNLLSNAIKYTPDEGYIGVQVSQDGEKVHIAVSDSGIGIDEENQAVVFNRFTRAEDTHGENIPGAGIGLALVKELVEGNDGEITLHSTLGQGSTFTVSLPVVIDVEYEKQTIAELSHSSQLEIDALHASSKVTVMTENLILDETKETILLIDDNVDMLELLQSTLMDKFNCLTAQNGEEGLALATDYLPDLVISDVMMPGISGFEVVSALKQNELTSHLPVVLLTAKGDTESRIRGWDQKADEYLEKPFDSTELRMRIDNLLDIRKLLRQRYLREFSELNTQAAAKIQTAVQANLSDVSCDIEIEEDSSQNEFSKVNQSFLDKIDQILEQNFHDESLDVTFLANELGISQRQLARKMKAMIDLSPVESIRSFRLKKAAEMLAEGHTPSVVAHQVGFSSHSYFSKCFKAQFDCLPSSFH